MASYFLLTLQTTNSPRAGNRGSVPNTTKTNFRKERALSSVLLHLRLLGRVSTERGQAYVPLLCRSCFAHYRQVNLDIYFQAEFEMNMYTLFLRALPCCSSPKCWLDPRLSGSPKLALQRQTRQKPLYPQPLGTACHSHKLVMSTSSFSSLHPGPLLPPTRLHERSCVQNVTTSAYETVFWVTWVETAKDIFQGTETAVEAGRSRH